MAGKTSPGGTIIKNIMTRAVETVGLTTPVQQAAEHMSNIAIGALPVCENGNLVGMITDRDITVRVIAAKRDPSSTFVRDVMTENPAFCFEDEDVDSANRLMQERQIRRVPVLDRREHVVGILSLGDLAIRNDAGQTTDTLRSVSMPS